MAVVASPPVDKTSQSSFLTGLGVYWHLFSLDAPTVAALWSWGFGKATDAKLPALAPILLAVGTWLVYVADRILDGISETNHSDLRLRHFFYSQHRKSFLFSCLIVFPVFAWTVFTRMSPIARMEDAAVFAFAATYFFLVHLRMPRIERWLPKELAVGVLFASATAVPAWSRASGGARLSLVPLVMFFAILCWLNCAAIEVWEGNAGRKAFHITTDWAERNFFVLAKGLAALAFIFAVATIHAPARCCLYLALGLASLLLYWLVQRRSELTALQFRVVIDAVLLTPLLFLAWMR